jgi:GT2 family glycosyltransferase
VTTRNRPESLRRCLDSIRLLSEIPLEVLVFDDGSETPAEATHAPVPVRVIRDNAAPGVAVGRNRLVREAAAPFVLLMDDDARFLERAGVERALAVMEHDDSVGAVAFAQAEADGRPWPVAMQPSPALAPAVVPAFIGFAHLLRRSTFERLAGYREVLVFYGEEKDYCIRLIEHGFKTVYLPDARVAHVPDPSNRSRQRHLRLVARNDCLQSICNDPLARLAWVLPGRFYLYFRMRRQWQIEDPWGWVWVASEVVRSLPQAIRDRRPVSRRTLGRWQTLQRAPAPYPVAADVPHGG